MRLLTTCFLLLTLFATSSLAQNLPAWAEPSDQPALQDGSSFQSRVDRRRSYDQFTRSRQMPQDGTAAPFPGPSVNNSENESSNQCEYKGDTTPCKQGFTCGYNKNDNGQLKCRNDNATEADEVPVDDYLPFLALAGILFAYYRLRT
jgi:hypothetical protein